MPSTGYANSWAIVIGVDDYAKWPKLQYAVRDDARHAPDPGRQIRLSRRSAWSAGKRRRHPRLSILAAFHDQLAHGVQKNDRIFVFFS
ncbi:hypothetical protein LP420_07240 [Massilia sp. B-10]|nr:hypothetical protein LP420_07240 [Massilia sp. B-10]